METKLTQYDEFAAKHQAAYAAFTAIYASKQPPPEIGAAQGIDYFVIGGLFVVAVASVIVSGSRTIPEFGGGVVGMAAFTMLEIGSIMAGYFRTTKYYDRRRHDNVKVMVSAALALMVVTMLAANIHAVLKDTGVIPLDSWINTAILLLVAASAPITVWLTGDILGTEVAWYRNRDKEARRVYEERLMEWREGLNGAWKSEKSSWDISVKRLSKEPEKLPSVSVYPVSTQTDNRQTGYGYNRQASGADKVVDWLNEHPEDISLPLRSLGERVGVNKDTASKGRRVWQDKAQAQ